MVSECVNVEGNEGVSYIGKLQREKVSRERKGKEDGVWGQRRRCVAA